MYHSAGGAVMGEAFHVCLSGLGEADMETLCTFLSVFCEHTTALKIKSL